ncbi:TetR/AcrR family transcriptional regulator [Cognatishimia sp. SS12]|uniref:TetR/AcrR family transcriptional regulator n=1 Tax=Cognatishimia sp. SS12 TaxID=2979465 RepID=UPI00232B6C81|nr:TetR/AcrR family transcriptional regulator [Cognatishimia sp. SS12]MDC0738999.1 TetR/AcrR family transcriptional regulator [Cognatishimia sp. SS12]
MARETAEKSFARIRQALVAEVAEKGIGATSVGAVAKRARVATGTIYLRFENKEEMLQQVYLQIKSDMHERMMLAAPAATSREMIRNIWFALVAFTQSHPQEFMFVEFAGAAQILTEAQNAKLAQDAEALLDLIAGAVADGTLAPLPVSTIVTLLVGPVAFLARQSVMAGSETPPSDLNQMFDRIWLSIAA